MSELEPAAKPADDAAEMASLAETHCLSSRGAHATKPPFSYLHAFFRAMQEPYEPGSREDGYVVLAVAQNFLTVDTVQRRLALAMRSEQPAATAGYDNMRGSDRLRRALAAHMKRVLAPNHADGAIDPDRLCVSAGAGAVIDNLFMTITSPGDGVLIPAPYYPAFDNDLRVRNGVRAIPVAGADAESLPTAPSLDRAVEAFAAAAAANSSSPSSAARALLLTNPSNPLGVVYAKSSMLHAARWALREGMHVVVDEVYASSEYYDVGPFVSALEWTPEDVLGNVGGSGTSNGFKRDSDADSDDDLRTSDSWTLEDARRAMATRLHVVYGLSKDFCASGYRVGVLSTRNEQVVKAMDNVAYFCCVPGPMQFAIAEMLEDEAWVDLFLEENSGNLRDAHAVLTSILTEGNVPVVPSSAGMFVWIDLSSFMKAPTWEEEKRLWTALFEDEKTRLLMTPGRDCRHNKPGCFRLCFAAVKREALEVAARRLVDFVKRYE
jgi:1-aminocyclopropane-1-carboxylate synthase